MADGDTTEEYLLQISAQDNASATVNQVNAALTQTLAQTQQLNLVNTEASTSYSTLADAASQLGLTQEQLVAMVGDTDQLIDANQQLAQSYDQVAQSAQSAASAEADSGDSGGGFNITGSRRGLTAIGSLAGGSPVLSDAARLVSAGAAFGAVGVALGGAAIVAKAFTDEISRETAAETQRLDVERQAAHDVTTLTSQQAQAKIDAAQASLKIDQTVNDTLQDSFNAYQDTILPFPGKVAAAFAGLDPTYNSYADALAKGSVAVEGEQAQIDALTDSMDKGATAAADQAAANKQLADQLVANSNKILEVDRLTTEQRNTRAEQDRRDIALINDQIQAGGLTADATYALSVQQEKLYDDYQALTSVSTTYAQQLLDEAAAKQALTDANQKTLDLLAQEGDVRDKIANTEADIQQIREDAATKASDLQKDFYAKDDAATAAANEKSLEIEANYTEQRQKIQRDFAASDLQDIGARDAYADLQARTKEQQQLTDAAAADKKAEDQLTKSLNDKYKADYDAYQKSLTQQEQAEAKELAAKDRTLQQEQVDLQNILSGEIAITNSMFSQLETIYITHAQNIVNGQHALLDGAGNAAVLVPAPSSAGVAYPQAPLPAVTGTAAQSHQHITVNVNGLVSDTAAAIVINHTMRQLDAMM